MHQIRINWLDDYRYREYAEFLSFVTNNAQRYCFECVNAVLSARFTLTQCNIQTLKHHQLKRHLSLARSFALNGALDPWNGVICVEN